MRLGQVAPYVWDSLFFDRTAAVMTTRREYTPRAKAKTVAVFEPNINACKNSLFPMAAIEELYSCVP